MLAWEQTFAGLLEFDDPEPMVPVLASALTEPELAPPALDRLLGLPISRAPREVIRKFHYLSDAHRQHAIERGSPRLIAAAQQLVNSDHVQTRTNVAMLLSLGLANERVVWDASVPVLLALIDDPKVAVRDEARKAFLSGLERQPRIEVPRGSRFVTARGADLHNPSAVASNPVLRGLSILLRRLDQHRDERVIHRLIERGISGFEIIGKSLAEDRESVRKGVEKTLSLPRDAADWTGPIEALFHWLRSPFSATRDVARKTLRERQDSPFLSEVARRLERETGGDRDREYPIYRHIRWDLLPAASFVELSLSTQQRLIHYIEASHESPEERSRRLSRLLPMATPELQRDVLSALKEQGTGGVFEELTIVLDSDDPEIQLLATELLEPDGSRLAFTHLVKQLGSPHERVRTAAQKKLAGQSLAIFLSSFDSLAVRERRTLLPILAKVDLHFFGQLRRALRSSDEERSILAIRTVLDGGWVSEMEETLFDLTVSPNPKIRATLANAFKDTSAEASSHYLRLFLSDPDPRVVANSIETLDSMDSPRAPTWFAEFRQHSTPRVRANSLLALSRRGDRSARNELESLAQGSSSEFQRSARWALSELQGAA